MPSYPTAVWDGDSGNRDSDDGVAKGPDYRDWDRVVAEVAAVQKQLGLGIDAESAAAIGVVGTSVTEVSNRGCVQQVILTLTDVAITITDGTTKEYGSALVHTFPQGAIKVLGVVVNLDLTCTGADFAVAGAGDYALGSAAATDQALTGTDLTWSTDAAAITVTIAAPLALHDTGEIVALYDGTTTPGPVYLNLAMDAGEGAGEITANGTITITFINLGDY
jgi:hypothetical protein